jgi:hypothetical protein
VCVVSNFRKQFVVTTDDDPLIADLPLRKLYVECKKKDSRVAVQQNPCKVH